MRTLVKRPCAQGTTQFLDRCPSNVPSSHVGVTPSELGKAIEHQRQAYRLPSEHPRTHHEKMLGDVVVVVFGALFLRRGSTQWFRRVPTCQRSSGLEDVPMYIVPLDPDDAQWPEQERHSSSNLQACCEVQAHAGLSPSLRFDPSLLQTTLETHRDTHWLFSTHVPGLEQEAQLLLVVQEAVASLITL